MRVYLCEDLIMKVSAIMNYGTCQPKCATKRAGNHFQKTNLLIDDGQVDTVAFKGRVLKGVGIGAAVGVAGLGLISLLSGGLATPAAFALYAAMGGTTGGMFGDAANKIAKEEEEKKKRMNSEK